MLIAVPVCRQQFLAMVQVVVAEDFEPRPAELRAREQTGMAQLVPEDEVVAAR